MEKVIIVHGIATAGLTGKDEYSYIPGGALSELLKDGYTVKSVNTIAPNGSNAFYVIVFVLSSPSGK